MNIRSLALIILGFAFLTPTVLAQSQPPFDDSMVVLRKWVPQVADGGGWKTEIQVLNRRTREVPVTVRFFKSTGKGWPLTTLGSPGITQSAEIVVSRIKPKGVFKLETLDTSTTVEQGFAYVQEQGSGDLEVVYTFRQKVQGRNDSEGTMLGEYSTNSNYWGLLDTSNGFSVGVAVVNPSVRSQQYLLRILDTDGAQTHVFPLNLQPAEHSVFDLVSRYPELLGKRGSILIENVTLGLPKMMPNSIAAVTIRFHPTGSFSATPVLYTPE
jgi:hypothetical protein